MHVLQWSKAAQCNEVSAMHIMVLQLRHYGDSIETVLNCCMGACLVGVCISQTQAQDTRESDRLLCILDSLEQEGECRVVLVVDAGADHADSQRGPALHVWVSTVHVLVYQGEAAINVPQTDESYTSYSRRLALVLILEDPMDLQAKDCFSNTVATRNPKRQIDEFTFRQTSVPACMFLRSADWTLHTWEPEDRPGSVQPLKPPNSKLHV